MGWRARGLEGSWAGGLVDWRARGLAWRKKINKLMFGKILVSVTICASTVSIALFKNCRLEKPGKNRDNPYKS